MEQGADETGVDFTSYDGIGLSGTVRHQVGELRASVLLVHGINSYRDEYGFYSDMADAFARVGISSFRFDWRCNGVDEGRPMQELTLCGLANDIAAAEEAFRSSAEVSPRLVIAAASFGGGVSVTLSRISPERFAAGLLFAPVLSYQRDYLEEPGFWSSGRIGAKAVKDFEEKSFIVTVGRNFSRQLINEFPMFDATPASGVPWFIAHGDADTSEPLEVSAEYVRKNESCELFVVPGAEHGFAEPGDDDLTHPVTKANHALVYEKSIEFLFRRGILADLGS